MTLINLQNHQKLALTKETIVKNFKAKAEAEVQKVEAEVPSLNHELSFENHKLFRRNQKIKNLLIISLEAELGEEDKPPSKKLQRPKKKTELNIHLAMMMIRVFSDKRIKEVLIMLTNTMLHVQLFSSILLQTIYLVEIVKRK